MSPHTNSLQGQEMMSQYAWLVTTVQLTDEGIRLFISPQRHSSPSVFAKKCKVEHILHCVSERVWINQKPEVMDASPGLTLPLQSVQDSSYVLGS